MCGIIAAFDIADGASLDAVRCGLNVLRHRGPDGAKTWRSPAGNVVLGHARLSIIDLAGGDQPLANEDDTIHVIVNGEFYDFERIRSELKSRGHRFRTDSDSEIVLHLYEEDGAECIHRLRGEFAFVLWDEWNRTLMAGRDRFGIKPLFYSQQNGRLLFASEIKALLAAGVRARWDEDGVLQTLMLSAPLPSRTLFRGVSQLPPGHYMKATDSGVTLHRYWDFDYPTEDTPLPERSDEEWSREFRALLGDAVRTRMRADVPVGCYLSGGIDSCSVLGLMARHATGSIRAFSLAFDHPAYDEAPIAREMAEFAGAEVTTVPVSDATLADDFRDAVWHGETLFFNTHCVAKFGLSRAVHDAGFKVVLTGEGADEILGGYPPFRLDYARSRGVQQEKVRQSLTEANPVSRGLLLADTAVAPPPTLMKRLGYAPAWIEAREAAFARIGDVLTPSFPRTDVYSSLLDASDCQLTGRHVVNQSLYLWSKTVLPNYVLTVLGDRMEMAHSVEGRLPFLDHCIVEFVRTLPIAQKIHESTEKFVLREAMKDVLTPTVYERHKHPFLSPPAVLKPDGRLYQLMQDNLRGEALKAIPFFDRKKVMRMLDSASSLDDAGKIELEVPLMTILSACVLRDVFSLSTGSVADSDLVG